MAVAKYLKDFQFMLDFHPSIQAMIIQQKANKDIENCDKRTVRDRIAAPMLKKRCPKTLAQIIAASLEKRPAAFRLQGFYCNLSGSSTSRCSFMSGSGSRWHEELAEAYDSCQTLMLEKFHEAEGYL